MRASDSSGRQSAKVWQQYRGHGPLLQALLQASIDNAGKQCKLLRN